MAKDKRKIYKCVRKTVDGNKDCLVIKFKYLRPIDIRELRTEINLLTTDFFVQEEPEPEPERPMEELYNEFPEIKRVHFADKSEKSCLKAKRYGTKTCKVSSR